MISLVESISVRHNATLCKPKNSPVNRRVVGSSPTRGANPENLQIVDAGAGHPKGSARSRTGNRLRTASRRAESFQVFGVVPKGSARKINDLRKMIWDDYVPSELDGLCILLIINYLLFLTRPTEGPALGTAALAT